VPVLSARAPAPPRFWRIALRPKWIAALALALGIAAGFAGLGQWQLERSIESATVIERDTETAVPLASIAEPQQVMTSNASGRLVTVDGSWASGDDLVVTGRLNNAPGGDGAPGDWVVRHLVTEQGYSLAVVVGFVEPEASIPILSDGEAALTGRYVPSEAPQIGDFESGARETISIAELINLWAEPGPAFAGYLVLTEAPAGLTPVAAPAPEATVELNLLNLFYALEWVLFGGFAVYLWWRLVKDEQEKEAAQLEGASDGASGRDPVLDSAPDPAQGSPQHAPVD
jgi:cytochrome oxidase assembly protein ShyY1